MADPRLIVESTIAICEAVEKVWGSAHLGLLLVAAYFRNQPVSTEELADRTLLSTETVRRRLKPLRNIGRITTIRAGRYTRYVATQQWAERTASMLEKGLTIAPQ